MSDQIEAGLKEAIMYAKGEKAGAEAMREACAKECERTATDFDAEADDDYEFGGHVACKRMAKHLRAIDVGDMK